MRIFICLFIGHQFLTEGFYYIFKCAFIIGSCRFSENTYYSHMAYSHKWRKKFKRQILESHNSYSLLAVPSIRVFYCERSTHIIGPLKTKVQQSTTDSTVSALEPRHTDSNNVIFPAGLRFYSVVIVWLLYSLWFFLLLYIIFIKSLSHPKHMLYTPPQLWHSS